MEDQFFTTITAEIDHATLTLDFVSAGQPPFFLIRGTEVSGHPLPGEPGSNLPVGIIEEVEYKAARLQLEPGDKLLFYSDGLPEMPVKHEGVALGFYELRDLLAEIVQGEPQLPINRIIDRLLARLAGLSKVSLAATENSSGDDITLLGLEVENLLDHQEFSLVPGDFPDIDGLTSACWDRIAPDLEHHGYAPLKIKIRSALNESLLNAWKHGHRKNNALPLTVRFRFGNDFTFEVIDQGPGFDFRHLPDPTAPENLLAESGRGLFMIRRVAQHVKWKSGGRHLQVTFQAPSPYQHDTTTREPTPNLWGGGLKR